MRFVHNGGGSRSIVCLILILLSISIVYAASIPAPRRDIVSIEGNLTRRAYVDVSSDDDMSLSPSPERPQSDASSYTPEIDYPDFVQQGGMLALFMQASDEQLTTALVNAGKLQRGTPLASTFMDFRAVRENGWSAKVDTPTVLREFEDYVPFLPALRSLQLSAEPRPQGKNERMIYKHEFEWRRNGQSMKVSYNLSAHV
jgi:hypothetical protein